MSGTSVIAMMISKNEFSEKRTKNRNRTEK